jgi:ATP-dependent RNA helicase RhlB
VPAQDGNATVAAEGERKRRRRRGGRNRRREGGEVAANAVQGQPQAKPAEAGRPPRGERRAPRERAPAEASSASARPSRQVAATAGEHPHAGKPSLFRRLTRLFTGR